MAKNKIEYPTRFNENYSERDKTDLSTIINWMNGDKSRTNSNLAKSLGCSDAYVSQLLKGTMPVESGPFIKAALTAIDASDKSLKKGEFVETETWMKMRYACDLVKKRKGFAIVPGGPGVGKSESIKHYKETVDPTCLVMTGSKSTSPSTVLNSLMKQLNIKGKFNQNSDKEDAIVEKLSGTNRLIILDETDKCIPGTPEPLRTIADKAEIGVVLAGNVDLRDQVKKGENHYDLILDRVTFWTPPIERLKYKDFSQLMRPYIADENIHESETFKDICLYAGKVCEGSARRLINALVGHMDSVLEMKRTKKEPAVISCSDIFQIAIQMMGISNPPVVTRKTTTQIPVT